MEYSDFGVTRQAGQTASGIRVVVYTIPNRPIAMTAAFNAGRRYDPTGRECLAHVAEHMIVAGTKKFSSKSKIASYIERLGGSIEAGTRLSMLCIRLTVANAVNFDNAVYLLNQLLAHSKYEEPVLKKELDSVRQELAVLKGDPSRYAERFFRHHLFSNTELQEKTIDNELAIDRVSIDDVRQYAAERLVAGNMAIVVAGGITFEQAIEVLNKGLEVNYATGSLSAPSLVAYQMPSNRIVTKSYPSSAQVRLVYGFPGYDMSHPDAAVLDVLAKILGGGRASSLARILRHENGLVYRVLVESVKEVGCGTFRIITGTDPACLQKVLELINSELERAAKGEITAEELEQAKSTIVNTNLVRLDAVKDFLKEHVEPDLYDLPQSTRVPGLMNAVQATTLEDITRVAQDVFRPGTSLLTLCGSLPDNVDELTLY